MGLLRSPIIVRTVPFFHIHIFQNNSTVHLSTVDTTDPTGELTHPPPPTEDHDTQSNVVSMTIVEAEVPSDTLLTSYTDHPSQTPPGTTSESGSGASTPRRARRESVAGRRRRESVVGRRDSLAGTREWF